MKRLSCRGVQGRLSSLPFFEDRKIKGNEHEVSAVVYLFEEFFEVEGDALFVKDAEGLGHDYRRNENNAFSLFAFLEDFGGLAAYFGTVGEPPDEGMCIRYEIHRQFNPLPCCRGIS